MTQKQLQKLGFKKKYYPADEFDDAVEFFQYEITQYLSLETIIPDNYIYGETIINNHEVCFDDPANGILFNNYDDLKLFIEIIKRNSI